MSISQPKHSKKQKFTPNAKPSSREYLDDPQGSPHFLGCCTSQHKFNFHQTHTRVHSTGLDADHNNVTATTDTLPDHFMNHMTDSFSSTEKLICRSHDPILTGPNRSSRSISGGSTLSPRMERRSSGQTVVMKVSQSSSSSSACESLCDHTSLWSTADCQDSMHCCGAQNHRCSPSKLPRLFFSYLFPITSSSLDKVWSSFNQPSPRNNAASVGTQNQTDPIHEMTDTTQLVCPYMMQCHSSRSSLGAPKEVNDSDDNDDHDDDDDDDDQISSVHPTATDQLSSTLTAGDGDSSWLLSLPSSSSDCNGCHESVQHDEATCMNYTSSGSYNFDKESETLQQSTMTLIHCKHPGSLDICFERYNEAASSSMNDDHSSDQPTSQQYLINQPPPDMDTSAQVWLDHRSNTQYATQRILSIPAPTPQPHCVDSAELNLTKSCLRPMPKIVNFIKSFTVNEKHIGGIDHSVKFSDDVFEHRFVILPRNHPLLEFEWDDESRYYCLSESEWRSLGIRQTRGWEHIGYSSHEAHILLFRRPNGTDPRTGLISKALQPRVQERLQLIRESMRHLSQVNQHTSRSNFSNHYVPTFGSTPSLGLADHLSDLSRANAPYTMTSQQIFEKHINQSFRCVLPEQKNQVYHVNHLPQFDFGSPHHAEAVSQRGNDRDEILKRIRQLFATIHLPLFAF